MSVLQALRRQAALQLSLPIERLDWWRMTVGSPNFTPHELCLKGGPCLEVADLRSHGRRPRRQVSGDAGVIRPTIDN